MLHGIPAVAGIPTVADIAAIAGVFVLLLSGLLTPATSVDLKMLIHHDTVPFILS
jgi:hypothetical protein